MKTKQPITAQEFIPKHVSDRISRIKELESRIQVFTKQLNDLRSTYNSVDTIGSTYLEIRIHQLNSADFTRQILRQGLEVSIAAKEKQISEQVKMLESVVENK